MPTARELVAGIRDLVLLPDSYLRIQALMRDQSSRMEEYSHVVQDDPALAARVLRVANSAFFGVSRKVETITLAISLMGIARLHDIVLSSGVIGAFSRMPVAGIDQGEFWRRSIHVGILSRMLARESGLFDNERLFVGGLLHDIGHIVLRARAGAQMAAAMSASRDRQLPIAVTEREELGFHYGDVGAELMDSWLFPDVHVQVCRHHPFPADAARFQQECGLVHLARQRVCAVEPEARRTLYCGVAEAEVLGLAGISAEAVERVFARSLDALEETAELLLPRRVA